LHPPAPKVTKINLGENCSSFSRLLYRFSWSASSLEGKNSKLILKYFLVIFFKQRYFKIFSKKPQGKGAVIIA
jgi:hypothetical protein